MEEEVEEEESLRSKDFSIISRKASISSLCFLYIASTAISIADMTVLAINYLTVGSMSAVEKL